MIRCVIHELRARKRALKTLPIFGAEIKCVSRGRKLVRELSSSAPGMQVTEDHGGDDRDTPEGIEDEQVEITSHDKISVAIDG